MLPHQDMPPDGTNITIPDLPLAAIAARMPSRFGIAGSFALLCSAAMPITLDVKRLRASVVANGYRTCKEQLLRLRIQCTKRQHFITVTLEPL